MTNLLLFNDLMRPVSIYRKPNFIKIFLLAGMIFMCNVVFAQIDPTDSLPGDPGGLSVSTVQNIHFGAFSNSGSGGTIILSNTGTRTTTGSIIPLNLGVTYMQAMFDIDAPQGSIISVLNGPDATLTGSNGGTMSMHIGECDPASPFITVAVQPAQTRLNIGGTLTVGNNVTNPPGRYTGTFYIIFNQE